MKPAKPLISIVIPAYNAENYIADAIRSVLNQTHDNIEVVIVDDGSRDGTPDIVSSFSDSRIRFLAQENRGQSTAINLGAEASRGDFIKLLDADDWINPEHLAAQLESIDNSHDMVSSCRWGYFVHDWHSPVVRDETTNQDYDEPFEWLIDSFTRDEGMMGGWKWLIPRSVWQASGGYDTRLSLNNDYHFSIKLLLSTSGVRFASEAVYSYRKGISSALSGRSDRAAMESAFLTTKLGTELLLQHSDKQLTRSVCADRWQMWLYKFYPSFPDLARKAEDQIIELGGSTLPLDGGRLLHLLLPFVGWKGVRQLQRAAYASGWQRVLQRKSDRRIGEFR